MMHRSRHNRVAAGGGESAAPRSGATATEDVFLQRLVAEEQRQHDLAAGKYVSQLLSVHVPKERLERYKAMVLEAAPTGGDGVTPTAAQIRGSGLTFTGNRSHKKCPEPLDLQRVNGPSRFANMVKVAEGSLNEFAVLNVGLVLVPRANRFQNLLFAIELLLMTNGFLIFVAQTFRKPVDDVPNESLHGIQHAINVMSDLCFYSFLSAAIATLCHVMANFQLMLESTPFSYHLQAARNLLVPQA